MQGYGLRLRIYLQVSGLQERGESVGAENGNWAEAGAYKDNYKDYSAIFEIMVEGISSRRRNDAG